MENIAGKASFLKGEYTKKLEALAPDAQGKWGKMNVQQMIEHMSDYTRIGSGKEIVPIQTPAEHLPKYREFLATEKPFKENTPNSLMSETPAPERHTSKADAIVELQQELDYLFDAFEQEPGKKATHPFFGELNYEESVQLLHKHAWHHLRQFGVE